MQVRAPASFGSYELDWAVEDGERVEAGAALGWLCPAGHCGLVPLVAPCAGTVARRTSLLPLALAGELLAVVGGGDAELRADEARLLAERTAAVTAELAALRARAARSAAARALLADDERRLRRWLEAATSSSARPPAS